MSNGTTTTTPPAKVPLNIAIAPFPEGFEGDADEFGQQLVQLMEAFVEGNFLMGLVLPPGSTLPTNDQGPIFMGGIWYWFNPTAGAYQPQTAGIKAAKNYVKNCIYQIQQVANAFPSLASGITKTFDMLLARTTGANVLSLAVAAGPPAGAYNDTINNAASYTVGTTLVTTPAATDLYVHEHLIEGSDVLMAQGQMLSLSFWAYTNAPGTYSVYITNSGRDHSYVVNFAVATANTWTYVSLPSIPAMPVASGGSWNFTEGATGLYIGIPMCVGTQWQTATLGAWQAAFYAGSAQNMNLLGVTNNNLRITGLKLEASPQCTYLTVPSFEADFHDAIRYYWTNFTYQLTNAGTPIQVVANVANNALFNCLFPRRMCKVPTVTPYGFTSYASGKVTNISTGTDYACATIGATQKGVVGQPAGLTAAKADVFAAFITADARLS